MNYFEDYKSAEPERLQGGNVLTPGRYDLLVTGVVFTNDRIRSIRNPQLKDNLPEWKDVTDQLAVTFVDKDHTGVITNRFNAFGFVRYSEIEESQREGIIPLGDEGYAVQESTMTRIKDETRTDACKNIINQFFEAAGLPEGSSPKDLVNKKVSGEVSERTYGEKTNMTVGSWRKIGADKVPDLSEQVDLTAETF